MMVTFIIMHMFINVHENKNFQNGHQLCFVNCDRDICVSIQSYIKPTPAVCLVEMVLE